MHPVPPSLKPITPFVQRANELKGQDDVMRYWCTYHAAQVAIGLKPEADDARQFTFGLLDDLEQMKQELADNEAITEDVAGEAYVQNFCDKVFQGADDEDRAGKANKATAKRFLAAASFLQVLASFGDLDEERQQKIKYAKWKATDIAKALKEGRTPTAGPPGSQLEPETLPSADGPPERDATLPELPSVASTDPVMPPSPSYPFPLQDSGNHTTTLLPPSEEAMQNAFASAVLPSAPTVPEPDQPAPTLTIPTAPFLDPGSTFEERVSTPLPDAVPQHLIPPERPHHQRIYHTDVKVDDVPLAHLPVLHHQPTVTSSGGEEEFFDPLVVSKAQKHAKFAISALTYDDWPEARKQLRAALELIGG